MSRDEVMDVSALRVREATIVTGVWLTFAVGALGALYVALTWDRPHRAILTIVFAVSIASAIAIGLLPRERIVRSPWREPFFLAWSFADCAMLLVGTIADGGTSSPLVLVLFMPVVFSSMSYPLDSCVLVGIDAVVTYVALALISGGAALGYEISFGAMLVCTAVISAWQAHNHKRQHRTLALASRTDPLTGCLNRRGFQERVDAEIAAMSRRGGRGAIVVLDIDQFKPVNDTFGHAAGDELLCWFSRTLESELRGADAVGRLGGDEFAICLPEISPADARASVARIGEALRLRAPASMGLALYPDDGVEFEQIVRSADARLYASRRGRAAPDGRGEAPSVAPAPGHSESDDLDQLDVWRASLRPLPSERERDGGAAPELDLRSELLDEIDASVVVTDLQGNVLSWNRGAEALYGWTTAEAVGRNAGELIVTEDTDGARLVTELQREGRWDGELQVCRKDRSRFTAYVRNRLVVADDGSPVAIVGLAVDVSARVAAEVELQHARDFSEALTECMGEGLFTLDVHGRLTYVNRAAEMLLGWSEGELHGRAVSEAIFSPTSDGDRSSLDDGVLGRALRHGETVRVEDGVFRTRDGGELGVAYTTAPFRTGAGLQGCVVVFQDVSDRKRREEEQRRDAETLACINRVEDALAEDRFELYAQPIIDLRSGRTVQHELLLRMREHDGRIVAPGDFLPAAERYSLIGEIDWWVIKEATRLAGAGTPVELNISARSVGDPDVHEHIVRCVEQARVRPGMLVFEITETAIIEDEATARMFCTTLQRLGCKIALDDFGTGYAGLTYLKRLPVDYLKLDIEFVRDLATSSASSYVVQAVLSLARDFKLQTVAEGVEDERTLELLRELGVDFAQGFHIGHPAPFAERPGDGGHTEQPRPRAAHLEPRRTHHRALTAGASRRR
ncbi:MAG TPA: EAL domain-containing protein [Solirubrobacteraceae bacterium]|jgi:diguanylate cyclase (GGDEF)-like protein/PAS domain S-box-containing protein|nr:EAL domain-containing protein [Solirubrobacteraceae bacterium]